MMHQSKRIRQHKCCHLCFQRVIRDRKSAALARSARWKRLEARGARMVLAWPRKVMARMLCSSWKNVHVLHIALCMRIAASNSQGVCRMWMRVALCGRGRVWCRGCASRGGVHCRGAGGVGAHAILSGTVLWKENIDLPQQEPRQRSV